MNVWQQLSALATATLEDEVSMVTRTHSLIFRRE